MLTLEQIRDAFPPNAPRYAHILGVIELARTLESCDAGFGGKLELAALYHDIGYAETWKITGFHPVDGALTAREHGLPEAVAQAILHHGGSWSEARRLRPDVMKYYGPACRMMDDPLYRAMSFCDLHTGPSGKRISLDERLADIRQRHAANLPLMEVMSEYEERFRAIAAEWLPVLGRSAVPITQVKIE